MDIVSLSMAYLWPIRNFTIAVFSNKCSFFAQLTLQNCEIYAIKHIFRAKDLVVIQKSSTFALCFSWY